MSQRSFFLFFFITAFPQFYLCHKPLSPEQSQAARKHMPSADVTGNVLQLLRNCAPEPHSTICGGIETEIVLDSWIWLSFQLQKEEVEEIWSGRFDGFQQLLVPSVVSSSGKFAGVKPPCSARDGELVVSTVSPPAETHLSLSYTSGTERRRGGGLALCSFCLNCLWPTSAFLNS